MLTLLALLGILSVASAECPHGPDYAAGVARELASRALADPDPPLPTFSLEGLLQSDVLLDRTVSPAQALALLSVYPTGAGTDHAPGFGDVAYDEGAWVIYVQPGLIFVADGDGGGRFEPSTDLSPRFYRVCDALPGSYQATAGLDQILADAAVAQTAVHVDDQQGQPSAPVTDSTPTTAKSRRRYQPGPPMWGAALAYDAALGTGAGTLFASAGGVHAWMDLALAQSFEVRVAGRAAHAANVSTEWGGTSGSLNSTSVRVTPDLRARVAMGALSLGLGAGPAIAVFDQSLSVADLKSNQRETVVGGHAAVDLTLYLRRGPGIMVGFGGEAYLHKSDIDAPLFIVSTTVGITGRKSAGGTE